MIDPLSREVRFTYDAVGRVETQRLPDGRLIGFDYDANGNLTDLTPPGRPPHGFDHTQVDLVRQYTPPDLGVGSEATVLDWNLDRQLDLVTRPDGLTIDPVYDPASGRLQSLLAPHGTYSYAYDPASGRLATVTDPDGGSLTFGYDGSLPIAVTWTGEVAGSVTHGYNDSFEVVRQTVNGAQPIGFDHDLDGLLLQAGALELLRDPATGFLDTTTLGSTADDYDFTAFGELDSYTATHGTTELYAESFLRDGLGRITDETETVEGTTTTYHYVYDNAGRLTDVERNGAPWTHYDYDPNSNRIGWTDPWGSGSGTDTLYDDHDRLLTYGDKTYTYTANGELQTQTQNGQTVTYDYDVLGNLRGVTLEVGIRIDYVLDAAHRRTGKKVDGTLVQGFLYQDALNPVAQLDPAGAVVTRFVYGAKPHVPDYMVQAGTTYRIVSDHLGSVRVVVDADTGTVAQRLDYDPFGRVMLDTNPGFQPFGYAGGLYDPQTGLLRFGARDYDPETGRWTSKDPIGFAGGDTNLYGYVLYDPINQMDPSGQVAGELIFFSRTPTSDFPYHVGFDTGRIPGTNRDRILMFTMGQVRGVYLDAYLDLLQLNYNLNYGIIGYGDLTDFTTPEEFASNLKGAASRLDQEFRGWAPEGTVCVDIVKAGLGASWAQLEKAIRQDYNNNAATYETPMSNQYFWRRNTTFVTFFKNTGRWRSSQ